MDFLSIKGKRVSFSVMADAGIVSDLVFTDAQGQNPKAPLYKNPWLKEQLNIDTPLLRYIQGEFLCLPFGGGRRADYPDWRCNVPIQEFPDLHGYCTAHPWQLKETQKGAELSITYPPSHPIEKVYKRVTANDDAAALDILVTITARRDISLPFGIHPNIALPDIPRSVRIEPAPFLFAQVIPCETEKGISLLQGNARFTDLSNAPLAKGGFIDLTSFPLPEHTEEIVQLCGIEGWTKVHFPDFSIRLSWDPADMPSCVLWISNKGRAYTPWNGRNLCLGVEPICGAYDLSLSAALSENPINRSGVPTFHSFEKEKPYTFKYSIGLI